MVFPPFQLLVFKPFHILAITNVMRSLLFLFLQHMECSVELTSISSRRKQSKPMHPFLLLCAIPSWQTNYYYIYETSNKWQSMHLDFLISITKYQDHLDVFRLRMTIALLTIMPILRQQSGREFRIWSWFLKNVLQVKIV